MTNQQQEPTAETSPLGERPSGPPRRMVEIDPSGQNTGREADRSRASTSITPSSSWTPRSGACLAKSASPPPMSFVR